MKKIDLNNTVIEVLDLEHGKRVKAFFLRQGVNVAKNFSFIGTKFDNLRARFYGFKNGDFSNWINHDGLRIATLEELELEEKGEVREIDYYLVNKECWGYNGVEWYKGNKVSLKFHMDTINYFREIGLLSNPEYFTPVYKEMFKVGDWVKIISWYYESGYEGRVVEIGSIVKDSNEPYGLKIGKGIHPYWWFREGEFRHATPSEIAEANRPKVGDYCKAILDSCVCYFDITEIEGNKIKSSQFYEISNDKSVSKDVRNCIYSADLTERKVEVITESEFNEAKSKVLAAEKIMIGEYEVEIKRDNVFTINGVEYYITELIYLKQLFQKGQVKSLNVGCSGQYKVTQEQIEQILAKLK